MRLLGHNGEINTIQGNLKWMQSRENSLNSPIWRGRQNEIPPFGNPRASDSSNLHSAAEVKVWCTKQESSAINIDMKANICCVKYNPGSSNHIAVGSADHHIHYYDLRNTSHPLHIFRGHQKTVSYVRFLSNDELASASTDSTLRLWDVTRNIPVRTLGGAKVLCDILVDNSGIQKPQLNSTGIGDEVLIVLLCKDNQ
ncbi:hypothetical protein L1887_33571 [Cichorium endivia]|nr:hypothetical protein L1887_33571 [Cichorium endivia]